MSKVLHRLQGLVSSHRVLLFLHAAHASAALFPEATRLAVRIALMKDFRSFSAIIGTVVCVLLKGWCCMISVLVIGFFLCG